MKKVVKILTIMVMVIAMAVPVLAADYTVPNDNQQADQGVLDSITTAYGPGSKDASGKTSGKWQGHLSNYVKKNTGGSKTVALEVDETGSPAKVVKAPDGTEWIVVRGAQFVQEGNRLARTAAKARADEGNLQSFSDEIGNLGLTADVATASGMASGFMGVIRVLLGIIVVMISVGMTIYSGLDLCYIAFPVFRNNVEAKAQQGGMGSKQGANGESVPKFISDDARYAVTKSETSELEQNPFVIYFKKRFLSYIVLAILLFILLTGRITVFTDIALSLVSGIIELIQNV